jgi:hypothetical protein
MNVGGYHPLKYPLLLPQPSIMIESDLRISKLGYGVDSFLNPDWRLAKERGYSFIYIPEHPYVWGEDKNSKLEEQQLVIDELGKTLSQWNGEHIVLDIGAKLGLYQEGYRSGPEKR